jgi:nucleoside-diphosphate-sugar epimerase
VKVAVTGATGFVGQCLLPALAGAGHQASALDLRRERFTGAEAVVHLAAIAHRGASREELERVNVGLAREMGQAAAAYGASLVYLSSVKVYGERSLAPLTEDSPLAPRDPYGESKLRAEEALRAIPGLKLAILRPPLVYGPGVKANFLALMRALARGLPLPFASIRNRRSLIYAGNLADGVLRCLGREGTFVIADGPGISTPDLCAQLAQALGRPARLFRFPPALLPVRSLVSSLEVDDRAIRSELGWRPPFSLQGALRATAAWYRTR